MCSVCHAEDQPCVILEVDENVSAELISSRILDLEPDSTQSIQIPGSDQCARSQSYCPREWEKIKERVICTFNFNLTVSSAEGGREAVIDAYKKPLTLTLIPTLHRLPFSPFHFIVGLQVYQSSVRIMDSFDYLIFSDESDCYIMIPGRSNKELERHECIQFTTKQPRSQLP